jgi:hypothetical protein
MASKALIPIGRIASAIHDVRGRRVMLDADLAALYGVSTKRLNEQVKRNRDRFSRRLHVHANSRGGGRFEVAICDLKGGAWRPSHVG